tara:strand:- start:3911 stop:5674 length:1764 start_codon:yes stop_codon:yes gene_type:complete
MAIEIILNGDTSSAVKELHDLEILASVEKGSVNANITTEQLTLVNEYAELVRTYIAGGANGTTNGIFEGLPLQIQESGVNVFDGYLDFLNDFEIVDPTTVKARIKKHDSNDNFQDRANGLTFGYLVDEGFINYNDFINVPYLIEKEFNYIEFAFIAFSIYSITRDIISFANNAAEKIPEISADAGGGFTGPIAAIFLTIALIILAALFVAAMFALLLSLIIDLVNYLISPIKYHKAMRVEKLLEKGAAFLGLSYNTSIIDIPQLVLLPSKTGIDKDTQQVFIKLSIPIFQPGLGIPSTADFGYTFGELLSAMNTTFNAEFTVENGVLQHHAKDSPFWIQQSSYTLPDILQESIVTNANELISDKIILFKSDVKDSNSLENFLGTTYEIRTRPGTFSDQRNILMNGFGKVEIPYALGNRKDKLNNFEKFARNLFESVDEFISTLGFTSNSSAALSGRIGVLKLETDFINVPKLMKMNATTNSVFPNLLPTNNRNVWSAKYLYNNYHNQDSFVLNNFSNQYYVYKNVRVPFGFEEFNQLTQNSYFYNQNGDVCKLEQISWNVSKDFALLDYRVQKKYTNNLVETYIEES